MSTRSPRSTTPPPLAPGWHENVQRVRYSEVDRMGYLWHGHYLALFEEARTDMLRASGYAYRDLEDQGILLVVVEANVRYLRPGQFEDLLSVRCRAVEAGGATLRIEYEVLRDATRLATGWTLLASCDRRGRPCRLPDAMRALVTPPGTGSGPGCVQAEPPEAAR